MYDSVISSCDNYDEVQPREAFPFLINDILYINENARALSPNEQYEYFEHDEYDDDEYEDGDRYDDDDDHNEEDGALFIH